MLTWEAEQVLRRYRPKVVAVTGSVGKTSTKDAIAHVLSTHHRLRKSQKSFNSEIGVPLTVLGLENAWTNPFKWVWNVLQGLWLVYVPHTYPDLLVLEVGADHPGDIERTAKWLRPDVAVVTWVGETPAHVEFYDSPKALAHEKAALIRALTKDGVCILNYDDPVVQGMMHDTRGHVTGYGYSPKAHLLISNPHIQYQKEGDREAPVGMAFRVDYKGHMIPIELRGACGGQAIYAATAAFAVASELGVPLLEITELLKTYVGPPGRMRLLSGIKGSILIDDTYNSSPAAVSSAFAFLKEAKAPNRGRKIAVLGDMLELGKYTVEAHKAVGFEVAHTANFLFAVGTRARFIAEAARLEGMKADKIFVFDDAMAAGRALDPLLKKGDIALIKGSQFMRMERVVLEVMAHPEDADRLLVRQESEWMNR